MVEGARLESVYTVTPYRGFESLSLRQNTKPALCGFFYFAVEGLNPRLYRKVRQIVRLDNLVRAATRRSRARHKDVPQSVPLLAYAPASLSVSVPDSTLSITSL